jgi:hypothetical protein
MLEVVVTVVSLVGLLIYLLILQSNSAGRAKNETKSRKAQQSKSAAADKVQATFLRRGRDLLDKLRSPSNRR